MTIYKYTLQIHDYPAVRMPAGARVLHVAEQDRAICIWAVVNPEQPMVTRRLRLAGTGHPLDPTSAAAPHIGTMLLHGGALVLHLFDLGEEP